MHPDYEQCVRASIPAANGVTPSSGMGGTPMVLMGRMPMLRRGVEDEDLEGLQLERVLCAGRQSERRGGRVVFPGAF